MPIITPRRPPRSQRRGLRSLAWLLASGLALTLTGPADPSWAADSGSNDGPAAVEYETIYLQNGRVWTRPRHVSYASVTPASRARANLGSSTLFYDDDTTRFTMSHAISRGDDGSEGDLGVSVSTDRDSGSRARFGFSGGGGEPLRVGRYATAPTDGQRVGQISVGVNGYGCNHPTGSFTVHELDYAHRRLWITWTLDCGPVHGEIRLNGPRSRGLDVMPTRVVWPQGVVGEPGRVTPVTVVNRSGTRARITDVAVEGRDFRLLQHTCGIVRPGGWCHVWVRYEPGSAGHHEAAVVLRGDRGIRRVPLSGTSAPAPPAGRRRPPAPGSTSAGPAARPATDWERLPLSVDDEPSGMTSWVMWSDEGNYVGDGQSYVFGDAVVGATERLVFVDGGGSSTFGGSFGVAPDQVFLPGVRVRALTRGRDPQGPAGIGTASVAGDGRACNDVEGSMVVRQAQYTLAGYPYRLAFGFRVRCSPDDGGDLRGVVRLNALAPRGGWGTWLTIHRSPAAVGRADRVVVHGRLGVGGGVAEGRPRVVLQHRAVAARRWTTVASRRLGSRRRYWFADRPRRSGAYRVHLHPTAQLSPATSARRWVRVDRRTG